MKQLMMVNFTQDDLTTEQWAQLSRVADETVLVGLDDDNFDEVLRSSEGLILRLGMEASASLMAKAPELQYIGMYGTGYGRIDVDAAAQSGITVTNVRDYATQSVAEFVLASSIIVLRDLANQLANADALGFAEPSTSGKTLAGKDVGIVGLGAIGMRTATLMKALGANVSYYSTSRHLDAEDQGIKYVDLETLVSQSSIVSLHVPANDSTSPLLTPRLVSSLPDGGVLINTAPNEVVDLDAVTERLEAGSLWYVFDHTDEMPADLARKLGNFDTCHAYPPLGYVTAEADHLKQQVLVDNVASFVAGTPANVVS